MVMGERCAAFLLSYASNRPLLTHYSRLTTYD
jgi:hypothetical protein